MKQMLLFFFFFQAYLFSIPFVDSTMNLNKFSVCSWFI